MIKKFKDYDEIQIFEGGTSLEPGGYELQVVGAKVEKFTNCEVLKVAFDIINHEKYAGFYSNRFKSAKAQDPNAKWGGVFDVFIPKDDGSELDGYTKQAFKRFITSVERSNNGYTWNWDENSLKGKNFGGIFGKEQFETKDGKIKSATKCRFPRSIDSIRSGDFTIPEEKPLRRNLTGMPDSMIPQQPDTQQNLSYGNLSDFEEILSENDVPF